MKASVEVITKEMAQKYLAKRDDDRPLSRQHLFELISRQKRGEWKINGDSLKFDNTGKLRDGQHRLMMVIETEVPITAVVVRDLEPDAFLTMDTGKSRNLSDVLAIQKRPNAVAIAASLRFISTYLFDRMRVGYSALSFEQLISVLDKHTEIPLSVEFVKLYSTNGRTPGRPGWPAVITACHYLFSRVDKAVTNDFIERYITGLRIEKPSDPVSVLRGQIVGYAAAKLKPNGYQIFGIICAAWNAHRAGREVNRAYKIPKSLPRRPLIDGFPKELYIKTQIDFLDTIDNSNHEEE